MVFKEGDWVILLLPNDSERLVQLKSNEYRPRPVC